MSDQKKDQKIIYVRPDYSFEDGCPCPTCGKQMEQVVFYVGEVAGQSSVQRWGAGARKETVTTTQYRNVRPKIGGFCVDCYRKETKSAGVIALIIMAVGAVAAVALTIWFAICHIWLLAVICGVFGFAWIYYSVQEVRQDHNVDSKKDMSKRADTLSEWFVNAYKNSKEKPCEAYETYMSSSTFKSLQK